MSEWLFKEDNYIPVEDKDKFLDKTIISILKILSKLARSNGGQTSAGFYNINPIIKLSFSMLMIILISISRNVIYLGVVGVSNLCVLFFLERVHRRKILSLALFSFVFFIFMLMPSILMMNLENGLLMSIKVLITVMIVNILSYSTKWNDMSRALKVFLIPDIFILVLEISIRYIYLLGEAALEMFYALKLKSIGKNKNKYTVLSGVIGNIFLKSKGMGEELYSAMECRGFTGEYSFKAALNLKIIDIIYSTYNILLITTFIFYR